MGNVLDQKPLIEFIDKIIYTPSALAAVDPIGVHYISRRIDGATHLQAIRSAIEMILNRQRPLEWNYI